MLRRVAVLAALSGCSFVMMNNPPEPSVEPVRCEKVVVIPVTDIVGAVASVMLGSLFAVAIWESDLSPYQAAGIGAAGLGLGAAFTTSAVVGFRRAGRCRRAIDAWNASNR